MPRSYVWRKITDRQDFPEGLADLIREGYVLVHNGAEYVGLFIHDEGRCWIGYKSQLGGDTRSITCSDPDDARKRAEVLMEAGMIAPRRASRFN